jgi:hypothetical protein
MSTIYAGNGTIPSTTSSAGVRVPIVSSTNAAPIKVTATAHGYRTGDSVEIEGHATNTAANGQFQITKVDANNYTLNGSTGNGVGGATGYSIDYQLVPAYPVPAPGESASMVTLAPTLEGLANTDPFLYRLTGKYRLYNQFVIAAGNNTRPYQSNTWADTGAGITTTAWTAFPSAQFTLASLSDTPATPSYSRGSEYWTFTLNFTVLYVPNAFGAGSDSYLNVGACINIGTSVSMVNMPSTQLPGIFSANFLTQSVSLSGAFEPTFDSSNLYLTIAYQVDTIGTASTSFQMKLLGPLTGYINQYRNN